MTNAGSKDRKSDVQEFRAGVSWIGDAAGCGAVTMPEAGLEIPIGGSKELGGCGKGANPEQLLLAAVGACFINTWAIFLKKLGIAYAEPTLRMHGELAADPAGGYRMQSMRIFARIPASLWAERRAELEKTLVLAEKYCIISKVAKAAMPVAVEVETL